MMRESVKLVIEPSRLCGKVNISGAKNSALKLLTATILTEGDVRIDNCPLGLLDIKIKLEMLQKLGKICDAGGNRVIIKHEGELKNELMWEGWSIRTTLLIFGALLAMTGRARVPLPGGCSIGKRKYDLHQMLLEKLGAKVWEDDGYLLGEAPDGLSGADIVLPIRSTGATENGIIAAVLAKGKTTIWNPHIRPEITELVVFLRSMGAHIEIRGQESIKITGVDSLAGTKHAVMPDNLEAITFFIASVITDGDIEIQNFPYTDLEVPLIHMRESGARFYRGSNSFVVRGGECYPIDISTGPYPGINSDMQPLFAVYGLCAKGESRITDLRFPERFAYVEELKKMGGDLYIDGNLLIVRGGKILKSATTRALDLRCGAALMLAGLVADAKTVITNAEQIQRGYENIDQKMQMLGGKVYFTNSS
jgi:UDP-N-acetylglucosamine 1-carboxyvinyltransferase